MKTEITTTDFNPCVMHEAGTVNSEEMMKGQCQDGNWIYVEMLSIYGEAPAHLRTDPEHFRRRWDTGEFGSFTDDPMVWVETAEGVKLVPPVSEDEMRLNFLQASAIYAQLALARKKYDEWQRRCEPRRSRRG